jgi:hypothetical protein
MLLDRSGGSGRSGTRIASRRFIVELKLILAIIAVAYGVIGASCLMWPERMQAYAIRKAAFSPPRFDGWMRLIRSPRYVIYLQIVGAMSSSAAVALLLILLKSFRAN